MTDAELLRLLLLCLIETLPPAQQAALRDQISQRMDAEKLAAIALMDRANPRDREAMDRAMQALMQADRRREAAQAFLRAVLPRG